MTVALLADAGPSLAAAWEVEAAPQPAGSSGSVLQGVSCTSARACTAVGYSLRNPDDDMARAALVERWDGFSWSIQPTPRAVGKTLTGVSCTSPRACTAVGYIRGAGDLPVVERWDGSRWSIQRLTGPFFNDSLTAVSCVSRKACVAVGSGAAPDTLVERWNGHTWTRERVPAPPDEADGFGGSLTGVSCTSATACTAVGATYDRPWAMRWDGHRWTLERVPAPIGQISGFLAWSVSCISRRACIGVGYWSPESDDPFYTAFGERWDGRRWSRMPVRHPGPINTGLNGVSCTSNTACTAVGGNGTLSSTTGEDEPAPLAESWNGTGWSTSPVPNPFRPPTGLCDANGGCATLYGVSCASKSACMAVGATSGSVPFMARRT